MIKNLTILILLTAISTTCFCQTESILRLEAQYYKATIELNKINPYEYPDDCINKANQIIKLYNLISAQDSTRIPRQSLFIPYSMIVYSYYSKKEEKKAIPYMETANDLARKYASQLLQDGFTHDALLGIATMLRDAYTNVEQYQKAIDLSTKIISTYKEINPKHVAYQQMAESQIYKRQDNALKVIESDKKALDFFERYGNDVHNFYSVTIAKEILEGYLYNEDYNGALQFIEDYRDRLNRLFNGKDDLEYENLNQTNKYLYSIYQHFGLHQKALNAAFLVSNYIKMTVGEHSPSYAVWMNNAACSYMDMYSTEDKSLYLSKADSLFSIVGKIWYSIPNYEKELDYATYLGNYGNLFSNQKDYENAEAYLQRSLSLYQQQNCDKRYILSAKSRLATFYGNSGNIEKSISLQKELLNEYEQRRDTLQIARICNLLSQLYWMNLDNDEAGELYANKAYEVLRKSGIVNGLTATITENLARIYYRIGLEERALQYSMESLNIKESLGIGVSPYELLNAREFFVDQFSDVFYYSPEGKEQVVINIESLCKSILKEHSGNTRDYKKLCWKANTVLAKTYMFFHKFDEAERLFKEILLIEEELWGKNSNNYVVTLNNLAYCNSLRGDYEKCRMYSLECIKLAPTHKNYENILSSSIALHDSCMVEKYLPLTYNASLDYLKKQFLYLGSNQREELIESGKAFGFSNFALPALLLPENEICAQYAYNSALVYKGLLLSTEKDVESTLATIPDEALKNEYKELKQKQHELQTISDSVDVANLKRGIELKEKEIIHSLCNYSDFTKGLDTDWKDVLERLRRGDVAIEFVELDKSIMSPNDTSLYYGAVLLKKEWRTPKFVLLHDKQITDSIIRNVIIDFKEAEDKAYNKEEWDRVNHQLYEMIWEPIFSYLEPNDCIYFSPVGMLSLAPMEILQDTKGRLMNEQYKLYRMSSTKYMCLSHNPVQKGNAVLYGGLKYDEEGNVDSSQSKNSLKREGWNYLPSSATEVMVLDSIFRTANISTNLYDNYAGTEESFKKLSGKTISTLHIATHGFYFNEDESDFYDFFRDMNIRVKRGTGISTLLRSGLMLSGGQHAWLHGRKDIPQDKEDGILLASEISLLDFHNVDLVTLSACQTGLGDISDDGVMGLQRGFKRAGVNSILMTLWPVNDYATRLLMGEFYRNLVSGLTKIQSLHLAQKYLRESNVEYNNPYYWAAFILLDDLKQ